MQQPGRRTKQASDDACFFVSVPYPLRVMLISSQPRLFPYRGRRQMKRTGSLLVSAALALVLTGFTNRSDAYDFNDSHFHLTNYIQEGLSLPEFLKIMGDRTGRAAVFGIPLQQKWDYFESGQRAPDYYLLSDAELYYYSFTDAIIADQYLKLPAKDRKRFDPMITGFNPTDMYAADHIRRVLLMYPGVFTGIGEFSVHKEFVSAKVAGPTSRLLNPALGKGLYFAREVGLGVILSHYIHTV